jgi:hypothetical protein
MALQPFNFYFFSGAGSITVNGSPPASSYNDGDILTIAVTFSDGNTDVEWIANNVSEGTTNPLVINMPIGGLYIRIIGSGAVEVTEQFRFFWRFGNGIGELTANGGTPAPYYEAGTSLEIETSLVPGFTFTDFNINNGLFTGLTNPYTFTMPAQDIDITVNSSGNYTPTDDYVLKYNGVFCDLTGQNIEIEILEKDYAGYAEERQFTSVRYSFGDFGADVLEPIVASSVNFGIVGLRDEFFELLDGGNRKWMVRMYVESVLFWEGYIQNSFLTVDEIGDVQQSQEFTSVDGLKSLDSLRVIDSYFTRIASGFEAMKSIAQAVNQSFDVLRPVHVACNIYETRLDNTQGVFEQILVPDNAVYEDGEQPIFSSPGVADLNTSLYIGEVLRRLLKPFMCRLFLWKNEFYIVSTPEFNKDSYTLFDYDVYGVSTGSQTVGEGLDLSCKFTGGQRTGKPVFTEFTVKLDLGVLDSAAQGGLIEYSFGNDDWILLGNTTPYPGRYQLTNFKYVNARPSNQPNSYPTGATTALVQFAGDEYCKIWGTTSSAGFADGDISYIEIDTYRNKNPIQVAQGVSNTLAFYIEFKCEPRFGNGATPTASTSQFCGVRITVGDYYLEWDGDQTFTWTLTETDMAFPILNLYEWNVIDIRPIVIPEDGIVSVRLYEVINDGGTADQYTIGYKDMSVKIEQNEIFTQEAIFDKFITDTTYSQVMPEIDVYIGDVGTDNSSSAIKLNIPEYNYPHSSLWTIDGVTEIKLSQIMLQEIANLQGRQNPRLIATALRDGVNPLEVVPFQNVIYDNSYWMVLAIDLDFSLNTWRIELHKLGDIPVS